MNPITVVGMTDRLADLKRGAPVPANRSQGVPSDKGGGGGRDAGDITMNQLHPGTASAAGAAAGNHENGSSHILSSHVISSHLTLCHLPTLLFSSLHRKLYEKIFF